MTLELKDNEKFASDLRYILVNCYLVLKSEKSEKLEDFINSKESYKNIPEVEMILLQTLLNNLTLKTTELFHQKLINFVKQYYSFCCNYQFVNFFINFYETRHLKNHLKEFMNLFTDVSKVNNNTKEEKDESNSNSNNNNVSIDVNKKKLFLLIGKTLYKCYMFEQAGHYFETILKEIDEYDNETKYWFVNCVAHFVDSEESNEGRANELISDIFTRTKKEKNLEKVKNKNNKKLKKQKKRIPKNIDPKAPLPDPERWLPRRQRKKYRNLNKNKKNYQGAASDNITTTNFGKK